MNIRKAIAGLLSAMMIASCGVSCGDDDSKDSASDSIANAIVNEIMDDTTERTSLQRGEAVKLKTTTTTTTTATTATTTTTTKTKYKLAEVKYMNSSSNNGCFESRSNQNDNVGNTYKDAVVQADSPYFRNEDFDEYYLDQKYKHFSGTVFLKEEKKTYEYVLKFAIYGDDIELFSTNISGGSLPKDFDLDVSDVKVLKISVSLNSIAGVSSCVGIGNPILTIE